MSTSRLEVCMLCIDSQEVFEGINHAGTLPRKTGNPVTVAGERIGQVVLVERERGRERGRKEETDRQTDRQRQREIVSCSIPSTKGSVTHPDESLL